MAKFEAHQRRQWRTRQSIRGGAARPRLCVSTTLRNTYAQLIDDSQGRTLAASSTLSAELSRDQASPEAKTERAKKVGQFIAQKAKQLGIQKVVFDRGPRRYHGRVKALAEAARSGGLEF